MLQIHPLNGQGRALDELFPARPDAVELGVALLAAAALASPKLLVQVDAVMREQLQRHPARFCATGVVGSQRLGEWLPSLVVEPDGVVVPVTYGMDRFFALGNLLERPMRDLAQRWHAETAPAFARASRRAYDQIVGGDDEVVFWFEAFTRLMRDASVPLTNIEGIGTAARTG